MARVFVDDALKEIPNRNELIVMAAIHARTLPENKSKTIGSWKNRAVESMIQIVDGKATQSSIVDAWCKKQSAIKKARAEAVRTEK